MKNTLENKAKFFALYWGQRVLRELGKRGLSEYQAGYLDNDLPEHFLELKPLSSISDEDAEYCIGKEECYMRKHDPNNGDYGMSPSAIFVDSLRGHNSYHIGRNEADYLRLKGYAVKWVSVAVECQILYGWIKLKES